MVGSVIIPIRWYPKVGSYQFQGVELMADFHIFRIPYEISAGPRIIWLKQSELPIVEAAFSINIYGNKIGRGRMP